jgi:hypothetical protein
MSYESCNGETTLDFTLTGTGIGAQSCGSKSANSTSLIAASLSMSAR